VLPRIRQRLRDDVVARDLQRRRQPLTGAHVELDGSRLALVSIELLDTAFATLRRE
jgi:hypothetical protein